MQPVRFSRWPVSCYCRLGRATGTIGADQIGENQLEHAGFPLVLRAGSDDYQVYSLRKTIKAMVVAAAAAASAASVVTWRLHMPPSTRQSSISDEPARGRRTDTTRTDVRPRCRDGLDRANMWLTNLDEPSTVRPRLSVTTAPPSLLGRWQSDRWRRRRLASSSTSDSSHEGRTYFFAGFESCRRRRPRRHLFVDRETSRIPLYRWL